MKSQFSYGFPMVEDQKTPILNRCQVDPSNPRAIHGHFKNLNGTDLLEVATIYKAYVPTKYNWIEYPYITYIYLYHL